MKHSHNFIDISGQKFGKLLVLEVHSTENTTKWKCLCDCGNIAIVSGSKLKNGHTSSCGCLKKGKYSKYENLISKDTYKRLQKEWYSMRNRCKEDYHCSNAYYEKGIKVCDEWKEQGNFIDWALNNGYSDELSLDRIENSKGYFPENCRWATMKTQQNNKTNNVLITYNGKTQTMSQWSDELGVKYSLIKDRNRRGIKPPELFDAPHKNQYR